MARLQAPAKSDSVHAMVVGNTLRAASGWLELGLAEDALLELKTLPHAVQHQEHGLVLRLSAEMKRRDWNNASETARLLCLKVADEPMYFIQAAYCLHETGDTLAAFNLLLSGPKALFEMAVFHYNLACYLWTLGHGRRARSHLRQAIALDGAYLETARKDRDLQGIGQLDV